MRPDTAAHGRQIRPLGDPDDRLHTVPPYAKGIPLGVGVPRSPGERGRASEAPLAGMARAGPHAMPETCAINP
ncbi:hypothetical protein TBS_33010 [Thermobispora bispora]